MLCLLPNQLLYSRFGVVVNSRLGNAVRRNRVKRRLREILRLRQKTLQAGWDLVLIARQPARNAGYWELESACIRLLERARLFSDTTLADRVLSDREPGKANRSQAEAG